MAGLKKLDAQPLAACATAHPVPMTALERFAVVKAIAIGGLPEGFDAAARSKATFDALLGEETWPALASTGLGPDDFEQRLEVLLSKAEVTALGDYARAAASSAVLQGIERFAALDLLARVQWMLAAEV